MSRRVLLFGGLGLATFGMAYGLWYAVLAEHQALDKIGSSLAGSFVASAQHKPIQAIISIADYRQAKYVYDRQVDVHGHWIGLAMLLLLLGIGLDSIALQEKWKLLLAWTLLAGSALFPLGVLLQTMSSGPAPRAVAVIASVLVMVSLAGFTLGLLRTVRTTEA